MHTLKEKHMMTKSRIIPALALCLLVIFAVASCTKTKIKSEPATTSAEDEARRRAAEEERQRALKEENLAEENLSQQQVAEKQQREEAAFENEDITFEFDSIRLTPEAQRLLSKKADWLMKNSASTITIEGHCDSRGTNEYNLALGEGRAQSAKTFLVDLGIDSSRVITISFGEERPLDPRQNEAAWAKNRRAHFVIEK